MKSSFVIILLTLFFVLGCTKDEDRSEKKENKSKNSTELTNEARQNTFWWPDLVDLSPLRQHSIESNPYGEDFNYQKEFESLDLKAVKEDIKKILTESQDWWPADYGHYGPFFIRMA